MTPRIYTLINNGTIKVFRADDKTGDLKEVGFLAADADRMSEADLMSLSIMVADLTESSIPVKKTKPEPVKQAPKPVTSKSKPRKRDRDMSIPIRVPGLPPDPPLNGPTPAVPRVLLLKTLFTTNEAYPLNRSALFTQLQAALDTATPKVDLTETSTNSILRRVLDSTKAKNLINFRRNEAKELTVWITDEGTAWLITHLNSIGYRIDSNGMITKTDPDRPFGAGHDVEA